MQHTVTERLSLWMSYTGALTFVVNRDLPNLISNNGCMSQTIRNILSKIVETLPETLIEPENF